MIVSRESRINMRKKNNGIKYMKTINFGSENKKKMVFNVSLQKQSRQDNFVGNEIDNCPELFIDYPIDEDAY